MVYLVYVGDECVAVTLSSTLAMWVAAELGGEVVEHDAPSTVGGTEPATLAHTAGV